MSTPTADVSCRLAWADDAEAIAATQTLVWQEKYAEALPSDFHVDPQTWREALARPGDARNRVLVALERARVTGFVVTTPAPDPDCDPVRDGEISELTVPATERGQGHGSRLLQAAVETLQADRFTRAVTWVGATDDTARTFFEQAGWAADGAHRELAGTEGATTKQVRLHTSIAPTP